jgi:hypothetical protein
MVEHITVRGIGWSGSDYEGEVETDANGGDVKRQVWMYGARQVEARVQEARCNWCVAAFGRTRVDWLPYLLPLTRHSVPYIWSRQLSGYRNET